MVWRKWSFCAAWTTLGALFAALAVYSALATGVSAASLTLGFTALFLLQGAVAETLGLRADEYEISFPRRLFPAVGLHLPPLWRLTIPAEGVSRIDSLSHGRVQIFAASVGVRDLIVAGEQKRQFLRFAKQAYPWVDVF